MKKLLSLLLILSSVFLIVGCNSQAEDKTTVKLAAAASLEKMFEQRLIPMYLKQHPQFKVEGTYAGSGKLQVQIEQGMAVDVFVSAAEKQVEALKAKGLVHSARPLLQNELVLVVPSNTSSQIQTFQDLPKAKQPAIGDPKFVPAGQYAKEALEKLGVWEKLAPRLSLGSNVVEVLNWVAQGSADAGIVYATDAASNKQVKVAAILPEGLLKRPIIYPLAVIKNNNQKAEVKSFAEFLQSKEVQKVYEEYGFAFVNK